MYNSGNSSKNVTGSNIIDGTVETVDIADDAVTVDKLANAINTDIATGVSGSTTAGDALPKAGGAMTGAITTNSTFDGVDVATRDGILTTTTATANDALPKTGGALTGAVTTNSTFDGRDVAADGVTADAALPKAGGTMTGTIAGFTSTGIDDNATGTKLTVSNTGVNSATTLAVGATPPSDVHTSWKNVFIGTKGNIISSSGAGGAYGLHTTDNAYYKASTGSVTYLTTDQASSHTQDAGTHKFLVAPSGTIDTTIAFTTALSIANSGVSTFGNTFGWGGSNSVEVSGVTEGRINIDNNSTGTKYCVSFYNPNGGVGRISTSGSSTSYNTSSDYRLKENVVPMTGSIDRLKDLKPSRFNFKADTDKTVDGFIAHEAQAVIPECVVGDKDAMMEEEYEVTPAVMDGETVVTEAVMGTRTVPDYQGIDQAKIVPLLVSALQEAIARIETLENA